MPRLTIISGKSRKSVYMEKLAASSIKSIFVLYGTNIPVTSKGLECWVYDRSEETKTDQSKLETDLNELMIEILKTEFREVYLYGNFDIQELNVLLKVAVKLDGKLSIIASIQDNNARDGQILIQEIH